MKQLDRWSSAANNFCKMKQRHSSNFGPRKLEIKTLILNNVERFHIMK